MTTTLLTNVRLIDPEGLGLASVVRGERNYVKFDAGDTEWFRAALRAPEGEMPVSAVQWMEDGTQCVVFSRPLRAGSRLIGAAVLAWFPGSPVGWPFWNEHRAAGRRLRSGLWSVEPHLEIDGVGVKFEELLVVEKGGARWLEQDAPPGVSP